MSYSPCRFAAYGSRNEPPSLCQGPPDLMHMVRAARRPVVSDRSGSIPPSGVMRQFLPLAPFGGEQSNRLTRCVENQGGSRGKPCPILSSAISGNQVRFRPWPPLNQRFRAIESTSSVDWPAGLPNPTGFLRVHRPAFGTFERLAELFDVLHGAVYPPPFRCAWVGRH